MLERGAQGRNRTTDTAIFSRMLYQLSYLGSRAVAIDYAVPAIKAAHPSHRFHLAPLERGTGR